MFHSINPKDLTGNVFSMIGDRWMLITAGTAQHCNTMTAAWGGLGVFWGEASATCYIRPQRYTKEFVDREDYFTLSFFSDEWKPALTVCGKTSGRDTDKIAQCGLTPVAAECGAPYFQQAELVMVCRKRYVQDMDAAAIPQDVKEKFYPQQDYHTMYIGHVIEVLQK